MILGFKEIKGFKALDAEGKKIGNILNVLVEIANENASLYVSTLGEFGRIFSPFTLLFKRDHYIFLREVKEKNEEQKTVKLASSGIKISRETRVPQKCDHLNWLVPKKPSIPTIHEYTRVYDPENSWIGVVYDFFLDTTLGKRAGLVIAPPTEMHSDPFDEKPPVKTYAIRTENYTVARSKVAACVVTDRYKDEMQWIRGLPHYSEMKSESTYENNMQQYIDRRLARGETQAQIQAELVRGGWDAREVAKVFDEMGF